MSLIRYNGVQSYTYVSDFGTAGVCTVASAAVKNRVKMDGMVHAILAHSGSLGTNVTARAFYDSTATALDALNYRGGSLISGSPGADTLMPVATPFAVKAGDAPGIAYTGGKMLQLTMADMKGQYKVGDKNDNSAWDGTSSKDWYIELWGIPAKIVTFGDSISYGSSNDATHFANAIDADFWTEGHRNQDYNLAGLVAAALSPSVQLGAINVGAGEQTASWGVSNFATRVTPYAGLDAFVISNFGINDITVGGVTLETLADFLTTHQASWASLKSLATLAGCRLVRQSILRVGASYSSYGGAAAVNPVVDGVNAGMATWCAANGVPNIDVDILSGGYLADHSGISGDHIHPNQAGYAAIAANLAAGIGDLEPDPDKLLSGYNLWGVAGEDAGYAAGLAAGESSGGGYREF